MLPFRRSTEHLHELYVMESTSSVTEWLKLLRSQGDEAAANDLWNRYFQKLVRHLRVRIDRRCRQVTDEEDIALSAMDLLFRGISDGKFPDLSDRDSLWNLLLTLAERRATRHFHRATAQKRGAGRVVHEGALEASRFGGQGITQFADGGPSPEFAAIVSEEIEYRLRLLNDPLLQQIALLEMEGYGPTEIREITRIGSQRTLRRKRQLIRAIWTDSAAE